VRGAAWMESAMEKWQFASRRVDVSHDPDALSRSCRRTSAFAKLCTSSMPDLSISRAKLVPQASRLDTASDRMLERILISHSRADHVGI
jgi:hypothetical protein